MIVRSVALFLVLVAALPGQLPGAASQDVDVDGEWELVTKAPQNEVAWKVVFKRSGEDLDVTMTGPLGKETKGSGTIRGTEIEWTVKRQTSRGETTLVYKGTVDGDAMTGEVSLGRLRRFAWEAKRKAAGEPQAGRPGKFSAPPASKS
jgi:hypothetical protein